MEIPIKISCPTCGSLITYNSKNQFRPFCSERCKLIDLGAWADEKYRITEDSKPKDNFI